MDCKTEVTEQWPAVTDINKIFLERGIKNTEALFVRIYDSENNSHGYENSIRPGSQTGNTKSRPSNLPSVKLVMAFPNSDGTLTKKQSVMFIFGNDLAILVFILRLFITVVIFLIKEILLSGNGLIKMGLNPELRQRLIPDIIVVKC